MPTCCHRGLNFQKQQTLIKVLWVGTNLGETVFGPGEPKILDVTQLGREFLRVDGGRIVRANFISPRS